MRRLAPLVLLPLLSGCVGFDAFLAHVHSRPGSDPNIPMADSENVRRVLGQQPETLAIQPEPGNIWPAPQGPEPTLSDLQNQPARETRRGFPPTTVPTPYAPDHREPRPAGRAPGLVPPPPPPPPASSVPGPGPTGRVVPTPSGPAIDAGGNNSYRQLTTPRGPNAIVVPNGNGTSTVINPNGTVQIIPTPH